MNVRGGRVPAPSGAGVMCLPLLWLLGIFPTPARTQESRATLLGLITDPSGAVVPGARVTATNIETEVRHSTESNGEGNYVIPYLPPGAYRLRVEQEGFRTHERGPVGMRIGDRARLDVTLQLGRVADSVVLTAETPSLQSADASMGSVIDARRVAELPIAHGNAYHLTRLVAGVVYTGTATFDRPFDPSHIAHYSMAGAYALRNEITLDGSPNSSITAARNEVGAAYVPPADIVGEMRITTVALDASVGHTEGGVISLSLKSGVNTPHGTAYYNHQTPELFANSWLANRHGQPRADFNYARWGASLLGPLWLPRLYSGQNRTFFLWGYEGIRERRPRSLGDQTVPTISERQGDFSALLALGDGYQLYDPATRRRNPAGGLISEPFAGNLIPRTRISSVATNILGYFPLPNAAGTADGQQNLARPDLAEDIAYANHAWRIDHNPSERNRVFVSAALYDRASDYLNYFNNLATGQTFSFAARRAALDDVHVLSANTVLNLRYAYNRFIRAADLNPVSHGFDLTTLAPGNPAWAAWNSTIDAGARRFPLIDIAGYFNLVGTSTSGVLFRPQDTHSFAGAADRMAGAHAFKFGGEYRVYRKGEYNPYPASSLTMAGGSATGWLRFGEDWTKGPTDTSTPPPIGAGLASFLLGLPTGGGIARRASFAEQSAVSAFYVQDDWKATKKLTLTLGLRYELEGPLTERFNRSVRDFDPSAVLPIEASVQANYAGIAARIPERPVGQLAVRGGLTFAGVNGQPRTLYRRDVNNLMPRIGLAYGLNSRTVVRAGYGVFFGALGIRRGDVYQTGFSQTTPLVPTEDNGLTFVATLDHPFPDGVLNPPGASLGAMTAVGDQISYFNTRYLAPFMQRWQLSVQRQLGQRVTFELAYVGNRGRKLETTRNQNGLPLEYLSRQPTRDQARIDYLSRLELDNPFYGVLAPTSPLGSSRRISRASLLTAYPQFTRMETTTNDGRSWYHSFQAKLEQRFSGGHTAGASYTWSKLMEAIAYLNEMDPAPYRTISAADYPHRFSLSWIYELPFGRGRLLAADVARPLAQLLSGWQVEGIYVYQSGPPLAFDNIVFTGNIKDIPLPSSQRSADRWFNTDAGFVRDSAQALAFNVRTFPLRFGGIRGPAMNNWDLSALKNSRVGDRATLQFRGEFLNAMNHVWFSNPNTNPASSLFGAITAEQGYMRRVQLGVKLIY